MEKVEKEIEKLRILGLEKVTLNLFHKTIIGRTLEFIIILSGFGSIFLYAKFLDLNIITSTLLGFLTWFFAGFIVDRVIVEIFRIDKHLDWVLKNQEGINELQKKGFTNQQIEELKEEVKNNPQFKKFTLDEKK